MRRTARALAMAFAVAAAATLVPVTGVAGAADGHPMFKTSKPAKSDVPTLHYKQSKAAATAECDAGDTEPPQVLATSMTPKALGIGVSEVKYQTYAAVISDPCGVGRVLLRMARWDGSADGTLDMYFIEYDRNGNEVWALTFEADPTYMSNLQAGTWWTRVTASDKNNNEASPVNGTYFYLQRWSRMSNNASPEPVKKGSTVTVSGALTRASWNSLRYYGYASQPVTLAFRTTSGSYSTVKTLKTSSTGTLKTTVTASQDGCFRFEFAGTTTTPAVKGTGDCVDVR